MKVVIISNRLPVTGYRVDGKILFKSSVGGLATGLTSYIAFRKEKADSFEYLWMGWPGLCVSDREEQRIVTNELKSSYSCLPVFLGKEDIDDFYNGFCNNTLWPLFHDFSSKAVYRNEFWEKYKSVNEAFFEAVAPYIDAGDIVWIHDYHLLLLPQLIRERFPQISLGFFLHIPFPSSEVFKSMPRAWRRELLRGTLGANLVGFHTNTYTQCFLKCLCREFELDHRQNRILFENRIVRVDSFPMGIDFSGFRDASLRLDEASVAFRKDIGVEKVVLSIDRLDYTKGILKRLKAFEQFLKTYPHWLRKVVLMLIVVPSRTDAHEYKKIKKKIDKMVGRINGKFSERTWAPVLYHYNEYSFDELVVMYGAADVAMVTPLRDGMNLVAKEFLACKVGNPGTLLLSEMAGASEELREALTVNPNSRSELVEKLLESLTADESSQLIRNAPMQKRLQEYDVNVWAGEFLSNCTAVQRENELLREHYITDEGKAFFSDSFVKSKKRLILCDYDGTLSPFFKRPELAKPTTALIDLLLQISRLPNTRLVIVTGRDREILDEWFGEIPLDFIAEHGTFVKENGRWRIVHKMENKWKAEAMPVLQSSTLRLPGSFLEHKEYSIVWHFRNSDAELSKIRVDELRDSLSELLNRFNLEIAPRIKSVELCHKNTSKALAVRTLLELYSFDFIASFGDDDTDEDVFQVLPSHAFSVKVGIGKFSRFNVVSHLDVIDLLQGVVSNTTNAASSRLSENVPLARIG